MVMVKSGYKNNNPWLSIVVVGRNEAANLSQLFESLPKTEDRELIYVDSQSEDESIEIALQWGAKVYLVEENSVYAPATGRFVGTKEAAGLWILYLDGDMILEEDFRAFLVLLQSAEDIPPHTAGFVGRTKNIYRAEDGSIITERDYVCLSRREMGSLETWGRKAAYHGGAVLYLREEVLRAGNWNPAVSQLEEVDLCSRISASGVILRAVDLPMVRHNTEYTRLSERLIKNFSFTRQERKNFGAGEVVAARIKEGTLRQFVVFYPYPFLIFSGLITAPLLYYLWTPLLLLVNILIALWIGYRKKWYYYLVYLGNLLQIIRGIWRYSPFVPKYRRIDD